MYGEDLEEELQVESVSERNFDPNMAASDGNKSPAFGAVKTKLK